MAVSISCPTSTLPCGRTRRRTMQIPHLQPLDSFSPSIAAAASHSIPRQIPCRSTINCSSSSSSDGGAFRFHPFHQPYHPFRTTPMHVAFDSSTKNSGYSSSGDEPTRSLAPLSNSNPFQPLSKDAALGLVLQAASGKGWTTDSGLEGPAFSDISGSNSDPEHQTWPHLSKSPRRRMRIAFTCNVCGVRTMRAINPHAYTDGTVFVQCKGCNVFHKLVDNLNLFFEWDGRLYKTMKSIPPAGEFYKLMQTDDGDSSAWPV